MSRVDVIIVTYNSAALVSTAIDSVAGSPLVERIVVVDNASSDGSAGIARGAGASDVISNECNRGFAAAVNQGLRTCTSDYVLLLNPDAAVPCGALEHMLSTMKREPDAAIVAPLLQDPTGHITAGAGRFASVHRRVGLCLPVVGRLPYFAPQYRLPVRGATVRQAMDIDYAFGAALLVDRTFLSANGGLDERFFLFCEDEDLCHRTVASGRRVLLDTAAVANHMGGTSTVDYAATEAQRLYSTYRLFAKWRGTFAAALYHRGIGGAFYLRFLAARVERARGKACVIRRVDELLDQAVLTGVDPLRRDAPHESRTTGSSAAAHLQ